MTVAELQEIVADPERLQADAFNVLREISHQHALAKESNNAEQCEEARQLVIRCLEHRDKLGAAKAVHDALLASVGLYPYLNEPSELGLGDRLAYEAHRPLIQPREDFVFHSTQANVYARLMDGETVVLTAPTSFGKTLIVDALVVSRKYQNMMIVVPTIALIDEVRRRLSRLNVEYKLGFRVITHPEQEQAERNIFVLTQERVLEAEDLPELGIAVIDEMYKLSLEQDAERGPILNEALYKLQKLTKQLYLLGPNVGTISELPEDFKHHLVLSNDSTVAVDVTIVERSEDERADLIGLCSKLEEPTLIFVKSPARANEIAGWLVQAKLGASSLPEAAEWLATNYHPEWGLVESLVAGIGLHHGRLPRALDHYIVSAFNQEKLRFLVCTSSLIEGVNTTAKNIIVLDDRIALRKYDLFTFKNIQGRSGRMFKHFIGRVFLFNAPPDDDLPDIEIPAISQPPDTPTGLLLAMDEEDLTEESRARIQPYLEQETLPVEVLRKNTSINLDAQLALAEELGRDPQKWSERLAWRGFPKYHDLEAVCDLLYEYFSSAAVRWGVWTPGQLTLMIWRSYKGDRPRKLIDHQFEYEKNHGVSIDEVILSVLTFQRSGLTFGFPKYLRVVNDIQQAVLGRAGVRYSDFQPFAAAAENAFLGSALAALDEYGLPMEVARKLANALAPKDEDNSLDAVLQRLKHLPGKPVGLEPFEHMLLEEAKADL